MGRHLALLHRADFRICNLECALSDRGRPWPDKEFHFWSYEPSPRHPSLAHRMVDLGADIVFGHSGMFFGALKFTVVIRSSTAPAISLTIIWSTRLSVTTSRLSLSWNMRGPLHTNALVSHSDRELPSEFDGATPRQKKIAEKMIRLSAKMKTSAKWNRNEGSRDCYSGLIRASSGEASASDRTLGSLLAVRILLAAFSRRTASCPNKVSQ